MRQKYIPADADKATVMIPRFSNLRNLGSPHPSHSIERLEIVPEDLQMRSKIADFLKSNPGENIYLTQKNGHAELHARASFGEHAPATRIRKLIFKEDTPLASRQEAIELLSKYGFKCDLNDKQALTDSLMDFDRLDTLWISNDLEFSWNPEDKIANSTIGFKPIYLATRNSSEVHDDMPEKVIVKFLEPSEASLREIEYSREISESGSPHIVKYIEHGYVGDDIAFVMENGGDSDISKTAALIRHDAAERSDGSPPIISKQTAFSVQLYFLRQAIKGLAAVHRAGYVHHDFKPDNCFIDKDGFVKLGDFGISQKIDCAVAEKLTDSHLYQSPEVVDGQFKIKTANLLSQPPSYIASARQDIWSLGMMLYEMAAGEHPFSVEGSCASYQQVLQVKDFEGVLSLPKGTDLSEATINQVNDFLAQTVNSDPQQRTSAKKLLKHPLFKGVEKGGEQLYQRWIQNRSPADRVRESGGSE